MALALTEFDLTSEHLKHMIQPTGYLKCLGFLVATSVVVGWSVASWAKKPSPISLSYQNILDCFPELKDDRISFKVDMKLLKELADKNFVTRQSEMRERRWEYLDSEGRSMVMVHRLSYMASGKKTGTLSLYQKDAKDILTEIELTGSQKNNPSQDVINNLLLGVKVTLDRRLFVDAKLNGVKMTYLRVGDKILDFELESTSPKKTLSCDSPEPPAIICTCAQ